MDATTRSILDAAVATLHAGKACDMAQAPWPGTSSRAVEVPWTASCLGRFAPARLFDIGLSLASLDYLGLLLAYARQPGRVLHAVDIIDPARVRGRYPESWWPEIEAVGVHVGDARKLPAAQEPYDMVTIVSVIEHIGFDAPSRDNPKSAFDRATDPAGVARWRDPAIDGLVLSRIADRLVAGGRCVISVPMGRGGAVLLRDSLGYYCAQWEYSPEDWQRLVTAPGFAVEETSFYAVDNDLVWRRADGPGSLAELDSVPLSHSRGVGMTVLRKI